MLKDLTPGRQKFEREMAGKFLVLAKIKNPLIDRFLAAQRDANRVLLIDLLAEYYIERDAEETEPTVTDPAGLLVGHPLGLGPQYADFINLSTTYPPSAEGEPDAE